MTEPTNTQPTNTQPTNTEPLAGQPTPLPAQRDGRLLAYLTIAGVALLAALLMGRPELAALVAPFVVALGFGLARTGPLLVSADLVVDATQVLEGEQLAGTLTLDWDGVLDVEILVRTPAAIEAVEPCPPQWTYAATRGPLRLPLALRARHWGRHSTGEVWVRARAPRGLLVWEGPVAAGPPLRVLPRAERLHRLLDPAESRTVAGVHQTTRAGDGYEFAELRPYALGDRLRDLNWGATARQRRPYVNRHHPEHSGDVVIVLDADADGPTEVLTRTARAAWAIASVHLQADDRVGVVGIGGGWRALHPAGGERARYQLLETMLAIGTDAVDTGHHSWIRSVDTARRRLPAPASALVIALTPLYRYTVVRACQDWQARGRAVAVAVLDADDLLPPPGNRTEALARRLWKLQVQQRRAALTGVGIPVVTVEADGMAQSVVAALRRARRSRTLRTVR